MAGHLHGGAARPNARPKSRKTPKLPPATSRWNNPGEAASAWYAARRRKRKSTSPGRIDPLGRAEGLPLPLRLNGPPRSEVSLGQLGKLATAQNIIFLLVLFLLANMLVIPATYPRFQTLDTLSSYTPQEAYRLIDSYGEEGRQAYAKAELTLDLVYPLISALLFSLAILYTFQRGLPQAAWLHKMALLPFGVLLSDYIENACVLTMLWSYPRVMFNVALVSNLLHGGEIRIELGGAGAPGHRADSLAGSSMRHRRPLSAVR